MSERKSKRSPMPPIPGIIATSLQIREELHEEMRTLQLAHRAINHEHVRICHLYQEAVELYLNARKQRELLAAFHQERAAAEVAEPVTQEALCADR